MSKKPKNTTEFTTSYLMIDCPEPALDKVINEEMQHINNSTKEKTTKENAQKKSIYRYFDDNNLEPLEKVVNPIFLARIPFKKPPKESTGFCPLD